MYTDNPIADFLRYDSEQEKQLSRLPKCSECRERIQDDEYYEIDRKLICPDCLIENHRFWTCDYIEEE